VIPLNVERFERHSRFSGNGATSNQKFKWEKECAKFYWGR